jgi:hypothetical protein
MTTKRRPTVREIEGLARKWTEIGNDWRWSVHIRLAKRVCAKELLAILKPKPRETRRTVVAESKRGRGGRR